MDKNAIKKYAVWARRELITRVSQRAAYYGITEKNIVDADAASIDGRILSSAEKKQRQALIGETKAKGYEQVMEAAAYTWFNRFTALRFLEVNGYLPSHVRVFTDDDNNFKPQILIEAINLDLDGLNMEKVYALKSANDNDELFKYLVITQCSALNACLPGMFQKIEDYTELLFPDNLLRDGSVIEQMITLIPEADWQDQVQIIGWLYQYYNVEPKDKVFENLKKNIKISKENIPAATQLFTPDWIVRYMVENSLGRLWVEGHPNDELKANWKYYLEEAEQEPEVQAQLNEIRKEYAALKPENIKVIDPCMGSGHILVYMFDVLVQIYESYGYSSREAVGLILQNNLYGLDIDDRAAQLAYFAVMMKARQYDRRIFSRGIQPHVYAIAESNTIDRNALKLIYTNKTTSAISISEAEKLLDIYHDAKEYGSILNVDAVDVALLIDTAIDPLENDSLAFSIEVMRASETYNSYMQLLEIAAAMKQRYHAVVTNPPYMGASGMGSKLSDYVKKNYPDSKSDLFAVFIERCGAMTAKNGYQAMITQHAWMFLSSYEKLRKKIQLQVIINMAHLGIGTFEDLNSKVVQSTAFVLLNKRIDRYTGNYHRLFEKQGLQEDNQLKEQWLKNGKHKFEFRQEWFSLIPGTPIAYWTSDKLLDAFNIGKSLGEIGHPRVGLQTSNNDMFLRFWYECSFQDCFFHCCSVEQSMNSSARWYPHNKGGAYRKWYGNLEYVIFYKHNGEKLRNTDGAATIPDDLVFQPAITYSRLGSGLISFRKQPIGMIYDSAAVNAYISTMMMQSYMLGFLNTKITASILSIIAPTINTQPGDIAKVPVIFSKHYCDFVNSNVENCIFESENDWDSYETSWDFKRNPLI